MGRAYLTVGFVMLLGFVAAAEETARTTATAARDRHWAYVSPVRPRVPMPARCEAVRNPIDTFVLERLHRESLAPSPEADRVTLLRRLSLDLIGLPPTIDEVDAFRADTSDDAYERQVERLLSSPHYGERWARHWLDAARYADSDGYEKDKPRQVWFYRDWVVSALNRDLPYDQFVIEQIAGDLLPDPTQDQLVATGFLRNSMINEEGGVDPEQFRMEALFDRMDAIGKGVLGITIQCAQCHDHKYDPLTQEEYYRMFAYLNNDHEANIVVYAPDELMRRSELLRQIHEIEADLQHRTPDWPQRMAEWETLVRNNQPQWTVVRPAEDSSGGQKHYVLADGSVLAAGYAPTKHETSFQVKTDLENIVAIRLELLNDPNLPLGGPGRSIKGLCALTEFKVTAQPADGSGKAEELKIVSATSDVNPAEAVLDPIFDDKSNKRRVTGPIDYAIDRKDETAWGIDIGPGRRNVPRQAVFVLEKPVSYPGGTQLTFKLTQNHGGWNSDDNQNHNLGRFRFAISDQSCAVADTVPRHVREIIAIPAAARSPAQTAAVFSHWRTTVAEWKDANDRIEALWRQHPEGGSQLVLRARGDPTSTNIRNATRRWFLEECGVGLGAIALNHLLAATGGAATATASGANRLAPRPGHHPARAKNVIFLFMAGAPSHLELFDNKPQLAKFDGTLPPPELLKGYRAAFINPNSKLLGPKFKFARHGQCGAELSELLPHLATVVDDIAIVKSMVTDAFNHAPAQIMMNTGATQFGRPSIGAWVTYGLGSESADLPGFVVFSSGKKGPSGGNSNWGSGFLPTVYQGVQFRGSGEPVLYLSNPRGVDHQVQQDSLAAINRLNQMRLATVGDPEIATRINSFEVAFRMQSSAPELMDIAQEPEHILKMYGVDPSGGKPSFAKNCLLARRLVERGVRFVELFHEAWDQHGNLVADLKKNCQDTDQACAALVRDLKQRGMLDETLVIWGGEFGRTPMVQGGNDGRDHHPNAFTMWLAGGGIRPGMTLGESDELGFNATVDRVHVHDLHATILHLLGFDHTKLTYRFQGRDFRLTDVHGRLVTELLA